MNATQRNSARAEPEFLHLGEIEHEIFMRRTRQGKPVFSDPGAFSEQLHALAQKYVDRRAIMLDKNSRKRFLAVAKAAGQLQEALRDLRADELERLGSEQDVCIKEYYRALAFNDDLDDSLVPDAYDDTLYPRHANRLLWSNNLIWLRAGAEQLSGAKRKGRPSNSLEFQIAREFVALCIQEDWPLTVSSTVSDRKDPNNTSRSAESDSIRCLAAVFAKAGISPVVGLQCAKTALRKLHQPQIHAQGGDGEFTVTLTLKQTRSHLDCGTADDMPNFIPQTR